jgi:hypothetical protein
MKDKAAASLDDMVSQNQTQYLKHPAIKSCDELVSHI